MLKNAISLLTLFLLVGCSSNVGVGYRSENIDGQAISSTPQPLASLTLESGSYIATTDLRLTNTGSLMTEVTCALSMNGVTRHDPLLLPGLSRQIITISRMATLASATGTLMVGCTTTATGSTVFADQVYLNAIGLESIEIQ